ncbi:putative Uncharacterized WD repeat-containing protein C9G1.05 [Glarea lozoyensis 74030]|uniref:Putative Uncharacterized WD repeat-containing protein C9G1.05 n=1 Tax=Glarea lozoyensis (strain ATCC 74030 / MF5533) TaxID=1104152 RepID=H0EDC5_GLAL7|nr:putative Uncharacterized WD repeat-containing protein C9G1.05 [Glarea lozoyensis 74030]
MSVTIEKILAASPNTERGRPTQLSTDPKGERIAYASGKSVFLRSLDDPSLSKQYTTHTAQTTVARFSPSGFYIASGDVSGAVKVWDAVEGVNTKDSKRFVTASADQTVKLWDVEAGKAVQTWRFGGDGNVGVVWPAGRSDGMVVSLNLAGDLNYLAEGTPTPTKVVQGHNKSVTAFGSSQDGKSQTFWTGSFEGRVCSWDSETGVGSAVDGQTHSNQVSSFTTTNGRAYSVGWDDTLRIADTSNNTFLGDASKLSGQPKGVSSADGRIFIATTSGIEIFSNDKAVGSLLTKDFTPTAIAASGTTVAVGDDQNVIHIYSVDSSNKLTEKEKLTVSTSQITTLSFTSSGSFLAAGNSAGKIYVFDSGSWKVKTDRWSAHTARVTCIAWNDEETHAVSGGLDTNVFVWSLKAPGKRVKAANAHKDGVNGVVWVGSGKVASSGGDAALKIWKVAGLE